MAVLPVPDIVRDMAANVGRIQTAVERQGQQISDLRGVMVTNNELRDLMGRINSMDASIQALKTELQAVMRVLERR